MTHSRVNSEKSCKVPTEESWGKAKEKMHQRMERLPFIQKLRILDNMKRDEIRWSRRRK